MACFSIKTGVFLKPVSTQRFLKKRSNELTIMHFLNYTCGQLEWHFISKALWYVSRFARRRLPWTIGDAELSYLLNSFRHNYHFVLHPICIQWLKLSNISSWKLWYVFPWTIGDAEFVSAQLSPFSTLVVLNFARRRTLWMHWWRRIVLFAQFRSAQLSPFSTLVLSSFARQRWTCVFTDLFHRRLEILT